ncbi:transmembrane protein 72 isoform X1 [Pelodiscus sinensis]|uniref:transmembrane protein 72 isoform X1 n=1 Tax=Pelodiscus sinensis TaxID=13735 RepID=UPI003F6D80C2
MEPGVCWTALEYTCRLLGVATAAVLVGVGAETLQRGQFQSLAVYLLFSGAAISIWEVSFFVCLLLGACGTYPPGSLAHGLWKRVRRPASFQKFLGYMLLSVACFLHPVLVWHVTIPGSMLVLTGLAYFLLSKRRKSPAHGAAQGPRELYVEPCAVDPGGDAEQTFTFPRGRRQQRPSLLGRVQNSLRGSEGPAPPGLARQVHFQEALVRIIPAVSESQAEGESEAEETTSDTAPILGPLDSPLLVTPLGATGPF